MDLQPLYEVKERLERAAVAGTGLLGEDFRLKRALEGLAPLAVALGSVGDLAFTALVILSMAWTLHWLVYRGEALAKAARALRWGDGETWGHFLVNPGMTVFLLAILALTWYNLR